jgi:pyrimidine oxygenase
VAFAPTVSKLNAANAKTGRDVRAYALFMIVADETDAAARAKWEHYKEGADSEAISWLVDQSAADKSSGGDTNVRQMADPVSAVNINMGTLVGSFATVARLLDEVAAVEGCDGVLLTFYDFIIGTEDFGARIQPLMKSRQHMLDTVETP